MDIKIAGSLRSSGYFYSMLVLVNYAFTRPT